jgi:hypothetical protein
MRVVRDFTEGNELDFFVFVDRETLVGSVPLSAARVNARFRARPPLERTEPLGAGFVFATPTQVH